MSKRELMWLEVLKCEERRWYAMDNVWSFLKHHFPFILSLQEKNRPHALLSWIEWCKLRVDSIQNGRVIMVFWEVNSMWTYYNFPNAILVWVNLAVQFWNCINLIAQFRNWFAILQFLICAAQFWNHINLQIARNKYSVPQKLQEIMSCVACTTCTLVFCMYT